MNEEWRHLLYPFGFVAQIAFASRFIVQWLVSEKEKQSVTPRLFWHLSIVGNVLLFLHSAIQLHFPMSLAQSQNVILSWRNLNLLGQKNSQVPFFVVTLLLLLAAIVTITFFAQNAEKRSWIATPETLDLSLGIHLFGIIGITSFAIRFWVQWWQAECQLEGCLTESFWWISLFGALVSGIYFFIARDWVNAIGPVLSVVPYSRNLYFMRRYVARE